MPYAPKEKHRPWMSSQSTKRPNQGRFERAKDYDTTRWRKARIRYLTDNPLCVECQKQGRVTPATVLDHIVQVRAGADFWDSSNWQGLCKSCHNSKSARERHGK